MEPAANYRVSQKYFGISDYKNKNNLIVNCLGTLEAKTPNFTTVAPLGDHFRETELTNGYNHIFHDLMALQTNQDHQWTQ